MLEGRIIRNTPVWVASAILFLFPTVLLISLNFLYEGESIFLETLDWSWIIASSLSALFLVIQRKWAWSVAMTILTLGSIVELVRAVQLSQSDMPSDFQMIFGTASLVLIFYILYFFRFPYLDGRDTGLFGIAHRYDVKEGAQVRTEDGQIIEGQVLNISYSGVLFQTSQSIEILNFADPIELTMESLNLRSVRASVRAIEGDFLRIKFTWLGFSHMSALKKSIHKLRTQK